MVSSGTNCLNLFQPILILARKYTTTKIYRKTSKQRNSRARRSVHTRVFGAQTAVCRHVHSAKSETRRATSPPQGTSAARRRGCDSTPSARRPSAPRWHAETRRLLPTRRTHTHRHNVRASRQGCVPPAFGAPAGGGVIPVEFHGDLWQQKTRVHGLSSLSANSHTYYCLLYTSPSPRD